jgi:hypothetical protein
LSTLKFRGASVLSTCQMTLPTRMETLESQAQLANLVLANRPEAVFPVLLNHTDCLLHVTRLLLSWLSLFKSSPITIGLTGQHSSSPLPPLGIDSLSFLCVCMRNHVYTRIQLRFCGAADRRAPTQCPFGSVSPKLTWRLLASTISRSGLDLCSPDLHTGV